MQTTSVWSDLLAQITSQRTEKGLQGSSGATSGCLRGLQTPSPAQRTAVPYFKGSTEGTAENKLQSGSSVSHCTWITLQSLSYALALQELRCMQGLFAAAKTGVLKDADEHILTQPTDVAPGEHQTHWPVMDLHRHIAWPPPKRSFPEFSIIVQSSLQIFNFSLFSLNAAELQPSQLKLTLSSSYLFISITNSIFKAQIKQDKSRNRERCTNSSHEQGWSK